MDRLVRAAAYPLAGEFFHLWEVVDRLGQLFDGLGVLASNSQSQQVVVRPVNREGFTVVGGWVELEAEYFLFCVRREVLMFWGEALTEFAHRGVIQLDHMDIDPLFLFELFATLGSFDQAFRNFVPPSFSFSTKSGGLAMTLMSHDEKESNGGRSNVRARNGERRERRTGTV